MARRKGPSKPRPKIAVPEPTLMIGWCTGGQVEAEFLDSMLAICGNPPYDIQFSYIYSGPLIARSRNALAMRFMESTNSHLMMVDTDIVFSPEHVVQLVERDKDIVSGLYYGLDRVTMDSFPVALRRKEDGSWPPIPKEDVGNGLQKVDAVGGGFVLIKRKVIEELGADAQHGKPFGEDFVDDRVFGEDTTFCYRATQAGFEVWLDPECRVGHKKPFII